MEACWAQVVDFYEFYEGLQEGWDGPALLVFSDGERIGARLDRNGLRPARFWVTDDDMVYVASEARGCPLLIFTPRTTPRRNGGKGPKPSSSAHILNMPLSACQLICLHAEVAILCMPAHAPVLTCICPSCHPPGVHSILLSC